MERPTIEGDSPVTETSETVVLCLSTIGHEVPDGNLGRPLPKAKYPSDR